MQSEVVVRVGFSSVWWLSLEPNERGLDQHCPASFIIPYLRINASFYAGYQVLPSAGFTHLPDLSSVPRTHNRRINDCSRDREREREWPHQVAAGLIALPHASPLSGPSHNPLYAGWCSAGFKDIILRALQIPKMRESGLTPAPPLPN